MWHYDIRTQIVWCRGLFHSWLYAIICHIILIKEPAYPDSKVKGANIGPTWGLLAQDGSYVGPMNLAVRVATPWTNCCASWGVIDIPSIFPSPTSVPLSSACCCGDHYEVPHANVSGQVSAKETLVQLKEPLFVCENQPSSMNVSLQTCFFKVIANYTLKSIQSLYSESGKTYHWQISWSLDGARKDVIMILSLWNLTGVCQISGRLRKTKPESRGIETLGDLVVWRPSALWIEALCWQLYILFAAIHFLLEWFNLIG